MPCTVDRWPILTLRETDYASGTEYVHKYYWYPEEHRMTRSSRTERDRMEPIWWTTTLTNGETLELVEKFKSIEGVARVRRDLRIDQVTSP